MSGPIRWLHLSDVHLGQSGLEVWHQVEKEFRKSLQKQVGSFGRPDLILFTGDLAYSGKPDEYKLVDSLISQVRSHIRTVWPDADPILVPVPGNHDVCWVPQDNAEFGRYAIFDEYAAGTDDHAQIRSLNNQLWTGAAASQLARLFPGYAPWFEQQVAQVRARPHTQVSIGRIPGDLTVLLDLPDTFPLCIVGLNSAWLQYSKEDFRERLAMPTSQFHAALPAVPPGGNPLDSLDGRRCLLLMHHPIDWQHPKRQGVFRDEVFRPERFDACLFGHMHEPKARTESVDGGDRWVTFQSPSLCGLEHYGTSKERRAFGYSLGQISHEGAIDVFPFMRGIGGGVRLFMWDQRFGGEKDHPQGVRIRQPNVVASLTEGLAASLDEFEQRVQRNETADGQARAGIRRGVQEELYGTAEKRIRVLVMHGDIRDSHADVIVSSDDTRLSAEAGVARRILEEAGDNVRRECETLGARGVPHGHVAATSGGKLQHCRAILHAAVIDRDSISYGYPTETEIRSVVRHSLACASAFGAQRIALPIIGGGTAAKYVMPWDALRLIVTECFQYIWRSDRETLKEVALYVYKTGDVEGDLGELMSAIRETRGSSAR